MTEKITLEAFFYKAADGKYKVVLSDDSIDREDEIVGKSFLEASIDAKIVGLLDHKNTVMGLVCEWVDKKIVKRGGHNAMIAEPKWFMSNPNAEVVKNMIEKDGATIGLSIGAIPSDSDTVEIDGKEFKRWLKGEILEASFVAIPANKHAQIEAIAKSLNLDKNQGVDNIMDEEQKKVETQKAKDIVKAMDGTVKEDVVKILEAAGIQEDIYKELVKDIPVELQKPKQKPKEEDDEDDPKKKPKDGKSLSKEEMEKIVEDKFTEKLNATPLFKAQADLIKMTPEQQKTKAEDIQKSGKLPILVEV